MFGLRLWEWKEGTERGGISEASSLSFCGGKGEGGIKNAL